MTLIETPENAQSWVGQRVLRKEDPPLVTGRGAFVADIKIPGILSVAMVRSPVARGRIAELDVSAARHCPGVVDVVTAVDLRGLVASFHLSQERIPPGLANSTQASVEVQPCNLAVLADGRVSYVGEPVAAVVATNRYLAEDAAEQVVLQIDEEPPIVEPADALRPGAPLVDEATPGNIGARLHAECGDVEAAFREAAHQLRLELRIGRITAAPMEGRGVLALQPHLNGDITVWTSTQVPYIVRSAIARQLDLPEDQIRVIAPHVGGGFGAKVHVYPEDVLVPHLAMRLGQPVRWVEDRFEHLMATAHGRDQIHEVEVAFDDEGVITGIKDSFVLDGGVGMPYPLSSSYNTIAHLRGMYRIPHMVSDGICVLTNKMANVPYRGSGRPEASFVIDRVVQEVARRVRRPAREVMIANMIRPDEMPFDAGIPYRDGSEVIFDGCDFPAVLQIAFSLLDQPSTTTPTKYGSSVRRGVGFGTYTEGSGVGPFESGAVMLNARGQVVVYSGCTPHGQGLDTTISQIIADEFGIAPERIVFRAGDTALLPYGVGTFASRSAVTAGSAAINAARKLKERIKEIASDMLELDPGDMEIVGGVVHPKGVPGRAISLGELYAAGAPGPGARLGGNREPGTFESDYFVPATVTWGYGVIGAAVAVDCDTGVVTIERVVASHDCGRIINPLIVEGQLQGGIVQGVGAALYEEVKYSDRAVPLTTSFMDYLIPTCAEAPETLLGHIENPSRRNPVGVKGVGESGTIAPPSAVANAIADALGDDLINPEFLNAVPIRPDAVLGALGRI